MMMKTKLKFFSTVLSGSICTLLFSALAHASLLSYATNSAGDLYLIDLQSGATTLIGNSGLGSNSLEGLAVTSSGSLYGTDGSGTVYSVSTSNGSATAIGSTGQAGGFSGLDTLANDSIYGSNYFATPSISNIDTAVPANTTQLQTASSITGRVRTMAMEDSTTALLLTNNQGVSDFTRILWSFDINTGNVFDLGTLTFGGSEVQGIEAMDFDANGNLYAITPGGDIYTVDYTLGLADSVSLNYVASTSAGLINWRSMAMSPVPLPAAAPLFISGIALLGLVRRRRMTG